MFKDFLNGFLASFRGIGLLFGSKKTMAIAGTPILLGVLSLIGFFSYVFPHYGPIHQYFEDFFVHTLGFTSQNFFMQFFVSSLVLLVVLAMLLASVYLLFLMTKLLASPFYGLLANQVFKIRGVKKAESLSIAHWIFLSFRTTAVNLIEVFVFAVIGVILFVFSFVPVINVVAAFGFFMIMAYDSTDYSLDLLNLGLSQRINYFFTHLPQFFGFALSIGLLMWVPGLNLILFAASVAGAADLVSRDQIFLNQIQTKYK